MPEQVTWRSRRMLLWTWLPVLGLGALTLVLPSSDALAFIAIVFVLSFDYAVLTGALHIGSATDAVAFRGELFGASCVGPQQLELASVDRVRARRLPSQYTPAYYVRLGAGRRWITVHFSGRFEDTMKVGRPPRDHPVVIAAREAVTRGARASRNTRDLIGLEPISRPVGLQVLAATVGVFAVVTVLIAVGIVTLAVMAALRGSDLGVFFG